MTEVQDLKAEETKKGIVTTLESLLMDVQRVETEKLNTITKIMRPLEEEKGNTEYMLKLITALAAQLKLLGLLPPDFKLGGEEKEEEVI